MKACQEVGRHRPRAGWPGPAGTGSSPNEVVQIRRQPPHLGPMTHVVGVLHRVRGRIRIWHKLAAIGVALLFPVVVTVSLLMVESSQRTRVAEDELRGLEYLQSAGALLFDLCSHERSSVRVRAGG